MDDGTCCLRSLVLNLNAIVSAPYKEGNTRKVIGNDRPEARWVTSDKPSSVTLFTSFTFKSSLIKRDFRISVFVV
jgi:hypothetical protein